MAWLALIQASNVSMDTYLSALLSLIMFEEQDQLYSEFEVVGFDESIEHLDGLSQRTSRVLDDYDPNNPDLAYENEQDELVGFGVLDDSPELDDSTASVDEALEEPDAQFKNSPSRGLGGDAYQVLMSRGAKLPLLSRDEIDTLVFMAQQGDNRAAEKLVMHNVRYIDKQVRRWAGSQVMNSSELRNDLFQEGLLGFTEAIHKYDWDLALERSSTGERKSFLGFAASRIRKRVGRRHKEETFGMNERAALERRRALEAQRALEKTLGRKPTAKEIEEVLREKAHETLKERGLPPTRRNLRSVGALSAKRIRELIDFTNNHISTDSTVGGDEDGRTLHETLASEKRTDVLSAIGASETVELFADEVQRAPVPHGRYLMRLLAILHMGLSVERNGRSVAHHRRSLEELADLAGVTKATVSTHVDAVRDSVRGMIAATEERGGKRVRQTGVVDPGQEKRLRRILSGR